MRRKSRTTARKGGKGKRKPIMRHSREGMKGRKAKPATKANRSKKPKRTVKARPAAKAKRPGKPKRTVKARPAAKKAVRKAQPAKARRVAEKLPPKFVKRRRGQVSWESLWDERKMEAEPGIQSGDMEGLSTLEDVDSESVEELLEEGQYFEAGVISGVEEAEARPGEVRTREIPVDDVPQEYLDED